MGDDSDKIKVAMVTGQHPFDVPSLHAVFRSIPDTEFYPQHMEEFVSTDERVGKASELYDIVVFYNFHQATPGSEQNWWDRGMLSTLSELGKNEQGIFVLHHALLAFPKWQSWSDIVGVQDRRLGYHLNQTIRIEIANKNHPITRGLKPWEMVDETYTMNDAGEGSEILLTTDHPKSMKTLAWTRQYKRARVFCYECGHDNQAYLNPSFRKVVAQGIRWLARKI